MSNKWQKKKFKDQEEKMANKRFGEMPVYFGKENNSNRRIVY